MRKVEIKYHIEDEGDTQLITIIGEVSDDDDAFLLAMTAASADHPDASFVGVSSVTDLVQKA